MKRSLGEYAERTEECAQATLDLDRKALGLLIEFIENTHQARVQAIRARQHFGDLLSVSSHHCERVSSRQRDENESIARTIGEARGQHRRQANYERHLRRNILTADEREASPSSSILLESRTSSTLLRHPPMVMNIWVPILVGDAGHAGLPSGTGTQEYKVTGII